MNVAGAVSAVDADGAGSSAGSCTPGPLQASTREAEPEQVLPGQGAGDDQEPALACGPASSSHHSEGKEALTFLSISFTTVLRTFYANRAVQGAFNVNAGLHLGHYFSSCICTIINT